MRSTAKVKHLVGFLALLTHIVIPLWGELEVQAEPGDSKRQITGFCSIGDGKAVIIDHQAISNDLSLQVNKLITGLQQIDMPGFGYSPTMKGECFAPLLASQKIGSGLVADHGLVMPQQVLELVKLGPRALPFLLKNLDNNSPTQLRVARAGAESQSVVDFICFAQEICANPLSDIERRVLGDFVNPYYRMPPDTPTAGPASYVVTVGDVCMVAIGQIVNRNYTAMYYQMTSIVVINSPTKDAEIARKLRDIWSRTYPHDRHWGSLMLDYQTRYCGTSEENPSLIAHSPHWEWASKLQTGAAMRLLYYYPQQAAPTIAERLRKLDVEYDESTPGTLRDRDARNGIRTSDFIRAVAWSQEPQIETEIERILASSNDERILIECILGTSDDDEKEFESRCERLFQRFSSVRNTPTNATMELLGRIARGSGDGGQKLLSAYAHDQSANRRFCLCRVLRGTRFEHTAEVLAPLLDDRRLFPPSYWERICDQAAEVIRIQHPEFQSRWVGDLESKDRQIAEMKKNIARKWPRKLDR
ncbi:MAG: hypothetical protein AABZ08_07670 [Planctomycetota bacterium]